MKKLLTIIILNYNGSEDTIACIQSLDKIKTKYSYRTIILDNNSDTGQRQKLEEYCKARNDYRVCMLEELPYEPEDKNYMLKAVENLGFAKGNNEIIKRVLHCSKYVLLLNNDTEVVSEFLEKMLSFLRKNTAVKYASCRINNYFQKDLLWSGGGLLKLWGTRHDYTEKELAAKGRIIAAPYIKGCALFLDTEMLQEQGMLTEDFFFGEEDFNFCWRMKKAGIKGACLNETLVYHKVSQSSKRSGNSVGKMAGYYSSRIVDMRQFYHPVAWCVWKEFVMLFVIYSCIRNGRMNAAEIKQVLKLVRKFSYHTKLTREDSLGMRML